MSPLWLACSHSSTTTRARASSSTAISALPGPVGAHEADVLPGPQAPGREEDLAARRDRRDDARCERLLPRGGHRGAQLAGHLGGADGVRVPQEHLPAARQERARHRPAVDAAADDGGGPVLGGERLGREHRGRSGAERGQRARIQLGQETAVGGVGEEDDAAHRRQSPLGVPRERRHPLQHRVAAAARRHRPEVAVGRRRHIDLGGHQPVAARVRRRTRGARPRPRRRGRRPRTRASRKRRESPRRRVS